MLYLRVNRSLPEKVFIVVMNSWSTASLTNGQSVIWDFPGDADGVGVTRPTVRATNGGAAIAGVAAETIVSGDFGLLQVWGYLFGVAVICSLLRLVMFSPKRNGTRGHYNPVSHCLHNHNLTQRHFKKAAIAVVVHTACAASANPHECT